MIGSFAPVIASSTAEVTENVLCSSKWPFAVNDPFLPVCLPNQFSEDFRSSKWCEAAMKFQLAGLKSLFQSLGELTTEDFFQGMNQAAGIWGGMGSICPGREPDLPPERRNGHADGTGFTLAGFLVELGFGVGANFVLSGAPDGLDFDTPDRDPAPQSVRFPTLVHDPDTLLWSGAAVSLGQIGASFRSMCPTDFSPFTQTV